MHKVVIVGASLAGLRTAEALRKRGYDGRVWLVGDEAHAPYDRPPLSKQVLTGEWDPTRVFFRQKEGYAPLDLELVLGKRATQLDSRARTVTLNDGTVLDYEGLVIATGAAARWPDVDRSLEGVHVLRSIDDATAIRQAFGKRPRVLVLGAGFIGLEVAASARKLGLEVTIVEADAIPLAAKFDAKIGESVAAMHRAHGADLRCGTRLVALEGAGRVERARLSDGTILEVDLVVAGIGVTPEVDWLRGSGVVLTNGVECDAACATNLPGIVAAGDVCSAPNTLFGETMRVEHWTNAIEQAQLAAATLLGLPAEPNPMGQVPYFWSDQYDIKLQFAGRVSRADELVMVEGDLSARTYVGLFGRAGVLCGVLASNRPGPFIRFRKLVAERAPFQAAIGATAAGGS